MRTKKEFLNKETLCDKCGFKLEVLFNDENYNEYTVPEEIVKEWDGKC